MGKGSAKKATINIFMSGLRPVHLLTLGAENTDGGMLGRVVHANRKARLTMTKHTWATTKVHLTKLGGHVLKPTGGKYIPRVY